MVDYGTFACLADAAAASKKAATPKKAAAPKKAASKKASSKKASHKNPKKKKGLVSEEDIDSAIEGLNDKDSKNDDTRPAKRQKNPVVNQ